MTDACPPPPKRPRDREGTSRPQFLALAAASDRQAAIAAALGVSRQTVSYLLGAAGHAPVGAVDGGRGRACPPPPARRGGEEDRPVVPGVRGPGAVAAAG